MARIHTTGSGVVLDLIRQGVNTRTELLERLGWSRATLSRRLTELLDHGIIKLAGQQASGGGRPREAFAINAEAGVLLALDIGSSHTRVAITDLVSTVLCEDEADIGLYDGPEKIFEWAAQVFDYLLRKMGRKRTEVFGIGVGVPGPVDPDTGRLATPQFDPRWDNVSIPDMVQGWGRPGCVVAVDRDVNMLAMGESRLAWPDTNNLVVVAVGSSLGCAFVFDGQVYRGSRGGPGQVSAPMRSTLSGPLRRFETVSSGATIRERLNRDGAWVRTSQDIIDLVAAGNHDAGALIEDLGIQLGYALADVVGLLNPAAIVIGGNLAELGDGLINPIRRATFAAAHPYSRQGLIIEAGRLGVNAGVQGAALMAQDKLFDADRVSEQTYLAI